MNRTNHSVLIISIASALLILGTSFALGFRYGLTPGLLTGVGSFTLLISFMLFANRRLNKEKNRDVQNQDQNVQDTDKE